MAKTPWRCSQCGTVNEPVATSCRVCGRWPSLFDIQDSAVGGVAEEGEEPDYELEEYEPDLTDVGDEAWSEPPPPTRRRLQGRRIVRLIVPIGVLLYIVISSYFSR
jgi:hypothetical protein